MCVHALGRDGTWCVCVCVRVCASMSLLGQDLVCMHVCVIREYQLLFLCKLYSKISVLVFLKAFVCRFSSLIQQVLLEILSVLKFLSFRCLIKSLRDSVGEKFQLNSVFTPGQYLPKAFMSFAVLVNWLE